MWIFTSNAFASAVRHRDRPGMLMVRGRLPDDLQRFFADHVADLSVERTPNADYMYRCVVTDTEFAAP